MTSKLTPTAEPKAYIERFVEGRIAPFSQKHPVLGKILCPLPTALLALIEATLRVALASITLVAYPFGLGFKKGGFQFAERGVTLYHQNLKMIVGSLRVIFKKHHRSPFTKGPFMGNIGSLRVIFKKHHRSPFTKGPFMGNNSDPQGLFERANPVRTSHAPPPKKKVEQPVDPQKGVPNK